MNHEKLAGIAISLHVKAALNYFYQGYNCSQSVFAAYADVCGVTPEFALRISSPFGAGIGRMREMCGALCGASMVCGVLKGNTKAAPEEKERIFAQVRNLAGAFRQEFGTIYCRELLHLDPNLQEGARPSVRTDDYYASRPCERCIAFCAALVEKFLEAQEGK